MNYSAWHPDPGAHGGAEEYALSMDGAADVRLLVLPALFEEANRLRRFTIAVMRHLSDEGIASVLPDLPGCNESLAPLEEQTLSGWRDHALAACRQFGATHWLAIRAGALLAPPDLPGCLYEPVGAERALAPMIRSETIARREAGDEITQERIVERGRREGIALAGWQFGAAMFEQILLAEPCAATHHTRIDHAELEGPRLWLRAEPAHDPALAASLAEHVLAAVSGGVRP